uniref:WW domain-containing protein n=1 Tax=Leersia perrieri TaxID=77586 RepID=A0A0D9VQK5_9ORYZ
MVSLQSALLLPESRRPRPPCLPLVDSVAAVASTATSKKRKRDDDDGDGGEGRRGEVGIELSFDAAPLPLEWQRCLDIKSGQIHYYNTRTHKRTSMDPRAESSSPAPESHHRRASPPAAAEEEETENYCAAPPGLDLELNLTLFEPRPSQVAPVVTTKKQRPAAAEMTTTTTTPKPAAAAADESSREMVAAVCARCHMLVMMCREWPSCPNCKFVHPTTTTTHHQSSPPLLPPEPAPLKLGLQLLCCKD